MKNTALLERIDAQISSLRSGAVESVPAGHLPFLIGGTLAGHIDPATARFLEHHFRFFSLTSEGLILESSSPEVLSRRLAAASYALKEENRILAWRDELLPVVALGQDESEPNFGMIERAACRVFGLTTFAVHLNAFTDDGRLWVAQRALSKSINPGMWDNIAAGIAPFGETFDVAMDREAHEEAGILPGTFSYRIIDKHLVARNVREGRMHEYTVVYVTRVPDDFAPHNIDGEVARFALLTPEAILEDIKKEQFTFESALSTLVSLRYCAEHGFI